MAQFSTQKVIAGLKAVLGAQVDVNAEHDGLTLIITDEGKAGPATKVDLPGRLLGWLIDLRLLRHVPLAYLVPDPALLPVESIRFFHVDRTWADRVVDGALSAGDIGTVDMTFRATTLTKIRKLLDTALGVGDGPITGMLIRSELVERWPDLIVQPLPADKATVIRQDVVSDSIMIVLFAGVPTEVRIREPDVGLRFGVEPRGAGYAVNAWGSDGSPIKGSDGNQTTIAVKLMDERVVNVAGLKDNLKSAAEPGDPNRARDVAINLRQQPYVARFLQSVPADKGSQPQEGVTIKLSKGRTVSVAGVMARRRVGTTEGGK
ncbi:MAG TPA: hypothetical protein VFB81_14220 [Myxococcales bacterium]|nr:hypothetical protein [Myxococcales bacterium]